MKGETLNKEKPSFTIYDEEYGATLRFDGDEAKCRADYEANKGESEEAFFDWCRNSYYYTTVPDKTSVSDHTKGEWYVNDSNLEGAGLLFVDVDNVDGEETYSTAICEVKLTHPTDTALADARLIAAAPDMLEALEAIRARLNGEWDHPALVKQGAIRNAPADDILAYIEAAIAKAKNNQ